jgi:diadenosine tetraphosphate (Ap4A) HIT family hydrolase
VLLGYLMVEPRRHVAGLGECTDEDASRLGVVVDRVAAALRPSSGSSTSPAAAELGAT